MGTVIILNDADFSASNLGKVTILPNKREMINQIVESYYTKTGDIGYESAIRTLVSELVNKNLWEKVKVLYPLLGTTLAQQSVDLTGTHDIVPLANASAVTNGMFFNNQIGIGNIENAQPSAVVDFQKRMLSIWINKNRTTNGSYLWKNTETLGVGTVSSNSAAYLRDGYLKASVATLYPIVISNSDLKGIYINGSNGVVKVFNNGVVSEVAFNTTNYSKTDEGDCNIYPYFGGSYSTDTEEGAALETPNASLTNGTLKFYGEAELDTPEEAVLLDSIYRDFCEK